MAKDEKELKDLREKVYSSGELPPENHADLGMAVYALQQDAQREMYAWHKTINKYRRYYKGDQLDYKKLPNGVPIVIENQILVIIETVKPRVVSSVADTDILPANREDVNATKALSQRVQYAWRQSRMKEEMSEIVHDLILDGGVTLKGFRDVSVARIDNRRILQVIGADSFEQASIIDQSLSTRGEIKKKYGRLSGKLKATVPQLESKENDGSGAPKIEDSNADTSVASTPIGESTPVYRHFDDPTDLFNQGVNKVLVIEVWYRDQATDKVGEREVGFDDTANKSITEFESEELKYPHGRIVTIGVGVEANGFVKESDPNVVVLNDRKNRFEKLFEGTRTEERPGQFPFLRTLCYPTDDKWSMSIATNIMLLQDALNKEWRRLLENIDSVIRPSLFLSELLGIEESEITNMSGQIFVIDGAINPADIRNTFGTIVIPPVINDILIAIEKLRESIERVSGLTDVLRGDNPSGVTAGVSLDLLRAQGETRILLSPDRLSFMMQNARAMLAYISQDFDTEKMVLPNESKQDKDEFTDFDPDETRDIGFRVEGTRRKTMTEMFAILAAMAELRAKGIDPTLALMYEDDPRFLAMVIETDKELKQEAADAEKAGRDHEVALAAANSITRSQPQQQTGAK